MRHAHVIGFFLAFLVVMLPTVPFAASTAFLGGSVLGVAGEPVAEAEVFLYRTSNIRRSADFISAKSNLQGKYRLELPVGTYWAVARVRKGETYGPMDLGYRHSGEPVQVSIGDEPEVSLDFTVADLREQAQKRPKTDTELIAISGRIIDVDSKGVALAYAYARVDPLLSTIPAYISGWSDSEGRFTLLLPPGNYSLGTARAFPPEERPARLLSIQVDARKLPVATDLMMLIE